MIYRPLVFLSFLVLISVNLFLVYFGNKYIQRKKYITQILKFIENTKSEFETSNQNLDKNILGTYDSKLVLKDNRVANLKNFFRKYNSPLFDYADLIVEVSDKYQFDYRLLPAIAMQESNLCKYIPENSHNCWGWGIYGTTVTKFDSYEEAIKTVARGIKKYYLDQGLITASKIMEKYTPSSKGSWAHGVNTFLKALE